MGGRWNIEPATSDATVGQAYQTCPSFIPHAEGLQELTCLSANLQTMIVITSDRHKVAL